MEMFQRTAQRWMGGLSVYLLMLSAHAQVQSDFRGTEPGIIGPPAIVAQGGVVARGRDLLVEGGSNVVARTGGRIIYRDRCDTIRQQLEEVLRSQHRYLPDASANAQFVQRTLRSLNVRFGVPDCHLSAQERARERERREREAREREAREREARGRQSLRQRAEGLLRGGIRGTTQMISGTAEMIHRNLQIIDNSDIREALQMVHGSLVDYITPAVLRREVFGSNSALAQQRSQHWQNRLKETVNRCIQNAPTTPAAALCFTGALLPVESSPLEKNLGMAVVYETSLRTLEPMVPSEQRADFRACRISEYLQCQDVRIPNPPNNCPTATYPLPAPPTTYNCTLRAVHNGIMIPQLAPSLIRASISETAPANQVDRITASAVTVLQNCLPGKENEREITACFDQTVKTAGELIVAHKVSTDPTVVSTFAGASERQAVVEQGLRAFRSCAETAQRAGRREGNILSIGHCEAAVTHEVGRLVVERTFERMDPAAAGAGDRALSQCWPVGGASANRVNECLRTAILAFSGEAARLQITPRVPAAMLAAQPNFITDSSSILQDCLRAGLPADILANSEIDSLAKTCEKNLKTQVAQQVARFEVTAAVGTQMSPEELAALIADVVDTRFMNCIGDDPSDDDLSRCEGDLRYDAGVAAGESIVPRTISGYVSEKGGASQLGTDAAGLELITRQVVESNTQCLTDNRATIAVSLNTCFQDTVVLATQELGGLQVGAELDRLGEVAAAVDRPARIQSAKAALGSCLRGGQAPDASIEAFSERIEPCSEQVTNQLRREVLSEIILTSGERLDQIIAEYEACLRQNSRNQDRCGTQLAARVQAFLAPYQDLIESLTVSNCGSSSNSTVQIFDLIEITVINLIQESRGQLAQTRSEIQELLRHFAGVAESGDVAALVSDSSTDPLLRSFIGSTISGALEGAGNAVDDRTQAALTEPALLQEVFTPEVLAQLRASAGGIVEELASGGQDAALNSRQLVMDVARTYLSSATVKTLAIQGQINGQVRRLGPLRFFAPLVAGVMGMDLNWARVRQTREGRAAEEWIVENVILPMVSGGLSPEESALLQAEASRLVTEAMKNAPGRN